MTKDAVNRRVIDTVNLLLSKDSTLTKSKLAQLFQISPSKFSEILNGRMAAGIDIMYHLKQDFGIDLNWLITGEEHGIGHVQNGHTNTIDHSPINVNHGDLIAQLQKENELLKERLKDKDEIINLLKHK